MADVPGRITFELEYIMADEDARGGIMVDGAVGGATFGYIVAEDTEDIMVDVGCGGAIFGYIVVDVGAAFGYIMACGDEPSFDPSQYC